MPPPKPVTDIITAGPGQGPPAPDPARAAATRNAQAGTRAGPGVPGGGGEGGPPGTPPGQANETIAQLNATLARYAELVSWSAATLLPLLEWARGVAIESDAHPEMPRGEGAGSGMREAVMTIEAVYERLQRMAAPSAPVG